MTRRGRHLRRVLWAACTLLAAGPGLAADHRLAPAGAAAAPAGHITAADLQDLVLADGDRVLLDCGARFAPLRLRTRGAGTVRVEPAGPCTASRRPVFDGRRPLGAARSATDATAGGSGRRTFTQSQPVVQVFAGDQPLPRARHPASGYLLIGPQAAATGAMLPADARLDPTALAGATLLARTQEWLIETRQVGADGRSLDVPLQYPLRPRAGVFFTGKAWMLGAGPGWAHDRLAQTLTVQGVGDQALSAALDEPLLQVHGSAGVVVQGIDFFGAGGNAVDVKSGGSVLLRDLAITLTGGNAVAVAGARLAQVEQLRIDRCGGDGVFFAEVARAEVRESSVRDASLLHGAGPALAAINAHRTDSALIERNRVERTGYIGIRVGGDALVQGNRVAQSCLSLADCAAIYTWRRGRGDHRAPVRVLGNLVVGVAGDVSVKFGVNDYFAGIYLDEWTRQADVRGNLLIDVAQGIYLHNAFDNSVGGNLVLGPRAQPLLELVDPPVRATLGLQPAAASAAAPDADAAPAAQTALGMPAPAEPPNRLQGALLDLPAGLPWASIAAGDVAALRAATARLLVIEGPPGAAPPDTGTRRCSRLLPLANVPQLPAQVLLCPGG
jgi:hypothetical protein